MAKKEYTKGEVIGIFGRIIGKGIELTGSGIFVISKLFARIATSLFWLAGKHVDMVDTVKEMRQKKIIDGDSILMKTSEKAEIVEGRKTPALPTDPELMLSKLVERVRSIESALVYAQSAYKNKVLPLKEICKIDNQAIFMAKAIREYAKQLTDSQIKSTGIKKAEVFLNASTLFLKYHHTGIEKFCEKAERYLAEAKEKT